jgi:hypothetical protein
MFGSVPLQVASITILASDVQGWEHGMRDEDEWNNPKLPLWYGREVEREEQRLQFLLRKTPRGPNDEFPKWVDFQTAYALALTTDGLAAYNVRTVPQRVVPKHYFEELEDPASFEAGLKCYASAYKALLNNL